MGNPPATVTDYPEHYAYDYTLDYAYDYTLDYDANYTVAMEPLCEAGEQEIAIKAVQTSIVLTVFVLGLAGNSLVLATFARYRRQCVRCLTDVFLPHLALSDLLLLLTLPLQAADTLLGHWAFGTALCKLTHGLHAINTYSGLLLLACIGADRYVLVARASSRRPRAGGRVALRGALCSLGVALASALLSLPDLLFSSVRSERSADEEAGAGEQCVMSVWRGAGDAGRVKAAVRAVRIAGFVVPFAAMVVCYSAIGRALARGRGHSGRGWRRQHRTLQLMVALVLLFLLFQLPHAALLTLRAAAPERTCAQYGGALLAEYVTRSLAYARCCLNPVLYALVGVRFRADVLRLLRDVGCACLPHLTPASDSARSTTPSSLPPNTQLSPLSSTHQLP